MNAKNGWRAGRRARRRVALLGVLVAAACGSRSTTNNAAHSPATANDAAANAPNNVADASAARELDLLPVLSQGNIDAAGPLVDLGETQSAPFVLPPLPIGGETLNGDSWATVGPRLRMRVPVDTTAPPTELRLRVRRVHARAVLAVIDGIPTRQVALPVSATPSVVSVPLLPDRFRRATADVELRFIGVARPVTTTSSSRDARRANLVTETRRVVVRVHGRRRVVTRTVTHPAGQRDATPVAALDIDWVHLVRGDVASVRTADLIADVRANGPPRRALALYSPTTLSAVTVIPPGARLHAAFSAEGIRGRTRPQTVQARVRIEADGVPPLEREIPITAGAPWQELDLDLAAVAGRATRITVAAIEGGDTRLAVAEPRLTSRSDVPPTPPPFVRHVAFIVVRGARVDRFLPVASPRFTAGGFARLAREGIVARAVAPAPRELSAFASAVTGLPADVHGLVDNTDTLDESAPTIAARMRDAGIATAAFSDDAWLVGSGIDRGFTDRETCANDAATCRAESVMNRATEWLVNQGDRRAFVMIATRAGLPPFDGPPEILTAIDPSTEEGIVSPERTAQYAARSRFGAITLDAPQLRRIEALYDASLAGVDRGIAHLLDRLRESNQLNSTAIVVVGDRGVMLGESGLVGDGPMTLAAVSQTVLMVRTPGESPAELQETVSVLDAPITAMGRFDLVRTNEDRPSEGPRSIFAPEAGGIHPRGIVFVSSLRGDTGLAFGPLVAMPRGVGPLALFQPAEDALGQNDVALDHPISAAFAERVLAAHRAALQASSSAANAPAHEGDANAREGDAALRRYTPSTRPLPPNVEAWLRGQGQL